MSKATPNVTETQGCSDGCGAAKDAHCWNKSKDAQCAKCGETPCPVLAHMGDREEPLCVKCAEEVAADDPIAPYRATRVPRDQCKCPDDMRVPLSGDGWLCGDCGADVAAPKREEEPWNWCPKCKQTVDDDMRTGEFRDGSEGTCLGCGTVYVATAYPDGAWTLTSREENDWDSPVPAPAPAASIT